MDGFEETRNYYLTNALCCITLTAMDIFMIRQVSAEEI